MDNLEKVYEEIAEESTFSKNEIRSIMNAQFSFVNTTIRNEELNDVRLKFLGIFKVKPGRLKYLGPKAKQRIKDRTDEYNHLL